MGRQTETQGLQGAEFRLGQPPASVHASNMQYMLCVCVYVRIYNVYNNVYNMCEELSRHEYM
jgi:hypothetical protein